MGSLSLVGRWYISGFHQDEQHTLPTRSKASEILRVCWSDSVEDPLEPDSHLFYVEVKRSRRKSSGLTSVLKFRGEKMMISMHG